MFNKDLLYKCDYFKAFIKSLEITKSYLPMKLNRYSKAGLKKILHNLKNNLLRNQFLRRLAEAEGVFSFLCHLSYQLKEYSPALETTAILHPMPPLLAMWLWATIAAYGSMPF